ncbi:PadR family transcriptional regulator [Candidatus Thorarchaeota archaeon]|nr:MAG: PadR family transcriptional regulator [Candidatus Thorarchaeota archaeon]
MSTENEPNEELCCPPDCCDMRGFLTFQILWEIGKEALNGQQIAEKIEERRGTKPTPGTIYPAIKDLREGRFIKGKRDGREIIYTLTEKGEKGRDAAAKYFYQAFGDIIDECRSIVAKNGKCSSC